MDLKEIFTIMEKAEQSSFNKIKIQVGDVKLSLDRSVETVTDTQPAVINEASVNKDNKQKIIEHNDEDTVFAPISGVFYVAKEPGAAPFVREGSKVKKGETLCIIEAMKTMNEISAPRAGVIESVLKGDSEPVTAKEALFKYAEGK